MPEKLKSRVALVTGGASGLGKAIAHRMSSDGANVVVTDVQTTLGRAVAAEMGCTFIEQDVSDDARWAEVVQEIEERFGRLDVLVNNAGILGPVDAANPESTRLTDWRRLFAVNVESVFLGCRAAIPAMRQAGGGSIINISSIAAVRATPHALAYGAGKAAVRQLTKSVAQYCAEDRLNIRCNSVHPGFVRTALWDEGAKLVAHQRGISFEEFVSEFREAIPLGDFTLAEDVAAAVTFLASDESRHITGVELIVDGGLVSCDTYRASDGNCGSDRSKSLTRD